MDADHIDVIAKSDAEIGKRALRALSTSPFFAKGQETSNGDIHWIASQRVRPCALRANSRHQNPSSKA